MVSYKVVGQSIPRADGPEKVTGTARFTADVQLPGTLWGKTLRSPYPHALITRIDTSRAEKVVGVHAVLTGADVRGVLYGRLLRDIPVLAQDRVRFIGERVAAVAAEDPDIAERALDLIDVEYEELPAVFDPLETLKEDAPILHPEVNSYANLPRPLEKPSNAFVRDTWERGDVEEGFQQADLIVENTFTISRTHQAFLEPHVCMVWIDEQDRVQVWSTNKAPHGLKRALAAALDIAEERIRVNPVLIGGDFGGKGAPMDEPLCYFLALHTGRPVKIIMDYGEEFTAGAPRHGGVIWMKMGVKRDGTMVAYQATVIFNSGAYGGLRPSVNLAGASHAGGLYRIPHARIEVVRVYTNNIPGGQMRAPGEPQGFFAAESHIDCVARRLGMDPLEFRLKNLIQDGDETLTGNRYESIKVKETLEAAAQAADYRAPKPANVGRGMAVSNRAPGGGQTTAAITLHPDGSVTLSTPVFEQGTGTYTMLRQVVAEELGLPPERIQITAWDTDAVPFDPGIGGSRMTRIGSGAAIAAAWEVKQELLHVAAEHLSWPEGQMTLVGDEISRQDTGERQRWDQLLARLGRSVTGQAVNQDTKPSHVTAFTAQVAEVSVDPETGQVKLLRFTSAHDVGRILNPMGHQGQIEGGVVQGIGFALMEEIRVEEGQVTTAHFGDYKIPSIKDIPELRTVLVSSENGVGPYKTKGIGENPGVPVAAAIANAVEDAVGVRIRDLPITAEKVYLALREQGAEKQTTV